MAVAVESAPPPAPSAHRGELQLKALVPVSDGRDGRFWASCDDGRRLRLTLATQARPRPHRRELAAYRIAKTLGLSVVREARAERIPVARLATLLDGQDEARSRVADHAVVANDGTVVGLVQEPCAGRALFVGDGPPVSRWAELAASTEKLTPREARSVHDYVQMVVLDYLTGNVLRRNVAFDEASGGICLDDHAGAFPGYLTAQAQSLLLGRIRPLRRFPVGLAAGLGRLERAAIQRDLQSGPFTAWLVGPRPLIDLEQRRATLRTLLLAKEQQYGEDQLFSLRP